MRIMYFKFLIIKIFFLIFYLDLQASSLEIYGLKKLSIEDIQTMTSIDLKNNEISEVDINTLISDLYVSDLIADVSYKLSNDNIIIYIKENNIIANVYINGNIALKDEIIMNNISSKSGFLYNKNLIIDDLRLIKNIYETLGFDRASIEVKTEKYFDKINVIFIINEEKISRLIDINFKGNKYFSDSFLDSKINSKSINFYNIFSKGSNLETSTFLSDKSKIKNLYEAKGFFDVKISYDLSKKSTSDYILNFYIEEGIRSKIEDIVYNFDATDLDKFFDKEIKNFKSKLEKDNYFYDLELIYDHINSFNQILVNFNELNRAYSYEYYNDGSKNILEINEVNNTPLTINQVIVQGNSITKDKTIRSKLSFQPGDYLNNYKIDKSKSDLSKLKYINNVNIEKKIDESNLDLIVSIDENKKTGNLLFGGSFSGDTGFGLGIGLKDSNIFGTGNDLDFSIDANAEKSLFKLKYSAYSLYNSNLTHNYTLFNEETDLSSSFGFKSKNQGFGYGISYGLNRNISLSTGFELEKKIGHSAKNNSVYITDNIDNFDQFLLNFSINQNKTNDILYPTDGYQNTLSVNYSPDNLSEDSYYKIILRNKFFYKFKNSTNFLFFNNNIGTAESFNGNLKTINAFSLGGLNFKGFDYRGIGPIDNSIYLGGNKFFTTSIGYGSNFLFDDKDNINIKLFASIGSVWDGDYSNNNDFELRSSIGTSFDILTAVGPISLSYAIPIEKNNEDKVKEFNFSIGTSF